MDVAGDLGGTWPGRVAWQTGGRIAQLSYLGLIKYPDPGR